MVYICALWCDGGCRNNGGYNRNRPVFGGYGVYYPRGGSRKGIKKQYKGIQPRDLTQDNPTATSNRAELHGLILALETARTVQLDLDYHPRFLTYINMDSQYVQKAMTEWRYKWERNGWKNAKREPVANQDLLKKAIALVEDIEDDRGAVRIVHIPRSENETADELANLGCDEAEEEYSNEGPTFYW